MNHIIAVLLAMFSSASYGVVIKQYINVNTDPQFEIVPTIGSDGRPTDLSAKLLKMRTRLIALDQEARKAGNELQFNLFFPPNPVPYVYSDNKWLEGLSRVVVRGERTQTQRTQFQCVSALRGGEDARPFSGRGITQNLGQLPFTGNLRSESFVTGDLLEKTAFAGSSVVTLADASSWRPGDRVFIHGLSQMSRGYPMSPRHYEFNRVVKIVGTEVTLETPLQFDYRTDWWDSDYQLYKAGRPRMLSLDRRETRDATGNIVVHAYSFPELIEISGIEFLKNPNSAVTQSLAFSARNIRIHSVVGAFPQFYVVPRESESFVVRDSHIGGSIEVDKSNGFVTIYNNEIWGANISPEKAPNPHAVKSGTGCQKLTIAENRIYNAINVVCESMTVLKNKIDLREQPNLATVVAIQPYNNTFGGSQLSIQANELLLGSRQLSNNGFKVCIQNCKGFPGTAHQLTADGILFDPSNVPSYLMGLRINRPLMRPDGTILGTVTGFGTKGAQALIRVRWDGALPLATDIVHYDSYSKVLLN